MIEKTREACLDAAKERLSWIDALRGYGAVMVILVHMTQQLQAAGMITGDMVSAYLLDGARAVQLFYIISGFTMFLSLEKAWGGYRHYLKKRYLSLFPSYYVAILLYFIVGHGYTLIPTPNGIIKLTPLAILLNTLGLHAFSVEYINCVVPGGWYVGIIWLYYLIAPAVFRLVTNTSRAMKCVFGAFLLRVGFHLLCNRIPLDLTAQEWSDMFILNQFVFIALGQVLYFVLIRKDFCFHPVDQLCLLAMLAYITLQVDQLMLWALIWMVLLLFMAKVPTCLDNRAARFLGKYSLEIYLLHNLVLHFVCGWRWILPHSYLTILVTLIFTLSITLLLSIGMHTGIQALKKR